MKKKTIFKKSFCSTLALLLVCLLLPVTAEAASVRLNKTNLTLSIGKTYTLKVSGTRAKVKWSSTRTNVATVSQKGLVKAKAPGKTVIRAKVGKKTYSCNVTVNANAKAKGLRFQTLDNGMFIQGSSSAKISFSLDRPSVNVTVSVKASNGSVVYKNTFRSCKANTTYTVTWNGKKGGTAVGSGTYTAVVKAGSIQTASARLIVRRNEFSGGTGSRSNPFKVANLTQFRAVARYNGYYFQQTAHIDGHGVEKFDGIYSADNPFNGTYDGNGFTIKNLIMRNSGKENLALFGGVGVKGVLRRITAEKIDLIGRANSAVLFLVNNGKIDRCTIKDCYITGTDCAGMLGHRNNETGLITNCKVSGGSIHLSRNGNGDIWSSGLIVDNFGSLMDSETTSVSMLGTIHWGSALSAGVVRWNTGKVSNCGATNCIMAAEKNRDNPNAKVHEERTAGICELNEGNISDCYSSGCTAKADGVYEDRGIVR